MRRSVSVVVPVKDGERHLGELLDAVHAQADDAQSLEVLVIDSGMRQAARSAAQRVSRSVMWRLRGGGG